MKKDENNYPGNDRNKELAFESPQNEESKRLSEKESESAVERKDDEKPKGEGETRGGNQSINQGDS